jgi:glycosyltransferase involved in cell wall biosynthesis
MTDASFSPPSTIRGSSRCIPPPDLARNAALDRATGDIIAYLDDDNVMHPSWLKAVAWAFDKRPNVDVLYGGIISTTPTGG